VKIYVKENVSSTEVGRDVVSMPIKGWLWPLHLEVVDRRGVVDGHTGGGRTGAVVMKVIIGRDDGIIARRTLTINVVGVFGGTALAAGADNRTDAWRWACAHATGEGSGAGGGVLNIDDVGR